MDPAPPPPWSGLLLRGLALTPLVGACGMVAMLVVMRPGEYLGLYLMLGTAYGMLCAAPVTLGLLPLLLRRGWPLGWAVPAGGLSALVMPRLTGAVGPTAGFDELELALAVTGALAAALAAWLLVHWTARR